MLLNGSSGCVLLSYAQKGVLQTMHGNNPVDNGMIREEVSETFLTFLRSPVMLARHLNICYSWFVITLVYYGLSLVSWSAI